MFHLCQLSRRLKNGKHGFSLVELIVVILIIAILAVAVFAGGSAAIKKAHKAKATSDLRNFQIAVALTMNENPQIANIDATTKRAKLSAIMESLNANLPADYKLTLQTEAMTGNISMAEQADVNADYIICKSDKTDAWDNPYFVILDSAQRGGSAASEFYMTTVSAGPNAILNITGSVDKDDIFDITSYSDGDVISATYDVSKAVPTVVGGASAATSYTNPAAAPVNNGKTTEFGAVAAVSFAVYLSNFQDASDDGFHGSFSSSVDENVLSVNMDGYLDEDRDCYVGSISPISALSFPFSVTVSGYDNDGQMTESIFFLNADQGPIYSNNYWDNGTYNITLGDIPSGAVYIGFGSAAYSTNSEWDYSGTTTFTFAS